MNAGTNKEHQILESLDIFGMEYDRQIILEDLKLRVNLDGDDGNHIYECKTYKHKNGFKCPLSYRRQVNIQMFASGITSAEIVAYGMLEEDYKNYFLPIDPDRLVRIPIEYDEIFIREFIARVKYLAMCLSEGVFPVENNN